MTPERKSLFIFLGSLFLCISFSAAAYYWDVPRNLFQEKTIPSPLLAYGETGKILRELGTISPVENKQISSRATTNPVEFLRRLSREKDKWLLLESFEKYKNSGIFGYIEMQSREPAVRFTIEVLKNGGWSEQVSSRIRPDKFGYSFFIDSHSSPAELRITFYNKTHPIYIYGMGFSKHDHHPLVFNDPISYSRFFHHDSAVSHITYDKSGAVIGPLQHNQHLLSSLEFKRQPSVGISKFHKKQGNTSIDLVASHDQPLMQRLNMSDQALAAISRDQIPVLSIEIEKDDLFSEKSGILENYDGHGREWERLGYTRFFKDGEPVFSTFSGVRLQGGDPGREQGLINFRLYFREEYGMSKIESGRIFNGSVEIIKRLAVKQSQWEQWPLNGPISYDVTRQAGGLAPPTELCLLYLNDQNLGLYYLVPHLGEKQIKTMLPDTDYQYFRIRGTPHDADYHFFSGFLQKIKDAEVMDEHYAAQHFDLDNLVGLMLSYIINGTGDYCQGVLLKGVSSESRYFWYGWDFDHSFADVPVEITKLKKKSRERWEQPPSFAGFFEVDRGEKPHHCARVNIFKRLLDEDPEFREKTKHLFASTINHKVTPDYVAHLLDEYQQTLTAIDYPGGEEYIELLREFFARRIPFLLKEIAAYYPTDSAIVCEVTSEIYPIVVDGFEKDGPYTGYYFPGATLAVESVDSGGISYWRVNGTSELEKDVELTIEADHPCQVHGVR